MKHECIKITFYQIRHVILCKTKSTRSRYYFFNVLKLISQILLFEFAVVVVYDDVKYVLNRYLYINVMDVARISESKSEDF